MGWATKEIEKLQKGITVTLQPFGNSMAGRIESGSIITISPCVPNDLSADDIVLVKVKQNIYLHLIKAIRDGKYLIGNNKGRINGWVNFSSIYGKVVKINESSR